MAVSICIGATLPLSSFKYSPLGANVSKYTLECHGYGVILVYDVQLVLMAKNIEKICKGPKTRCNDQEK